MKFKILVISLTVLQIKVIASQYISNVGSGILASPATVSAPISLAGPTTISAPVLAGPASISASASLASQASFANSAFASPVSLNAANYQAISSGAPSVFTVTSTSPIAPIGVSVFADSIYLEGPLSVQGQLPYLGTVALEGALPSSGQGVANCGCGNGNVGIVSEGLGAPGTAVTGGIFY